MFFLLLTAIELVISGSNRLAKIKPNMRLSYIRGKDDHGRDNTGYKFTPEGNSDGKWITVLSGEASKEYL